MKRWGSFGAGLVSIALQQGARLPRVRAVDGIFMREKGKDDQIQVAQYFGFVADWDDGQSWDVEHQAMIRDNGSEFKVATPRRALAAANSDDREPQVSPRVL